MSASTSSSRTPPPWVSPAQPLTIYGALLNELLSEKQMKDAKFPYPGERWQQNTESNVPMAVQRVALMPKASSNQRIKYKALVIDCEMVTTRGPPSSPNINDLISVAIVDFVSGDVVLHCLVQPTAYVTNWNFRYTGVNPAILKAAKGDPNQQVLRGWPAARTKIFEFADENTLFLGHAVHNDLRILRICTDKVVDSLVLTAHAAFGKDGDGPNRTWGLKGLCKELLGIEIQKKKSGHDCLEDAFATRQLIIWCLTQPEKLKAWGKKSKEAFDKEFAKRQEEQRAAGELRRLKNREVWIKRRIVRIDQRMNETYEEECARDQDDECPEFNEEEERDFPAYKALLEKELVEIDAEYKIKLKDWMRKKQEANSLKKMEASTFRDGPEIGERPTDREMGQQHERKPKPGSAAQN
ncbi:ribonuclease H-like domain-containing protein [Xylariaceae sp. FL1272]|nr:ribonuclease H-like domain-containing protein [Xylariaceae sp. FL1272]